MTGGRSQNQNEKPAELRGRMAGVVLLLVWVLFVFGSYIVQSLREIIPKLASLMGG